MRKRIEQLRQQENLTQEAFAKRLGMSRNFIWMVENGKREVSDRTITDICREFHVNETWLRTGEGEMYVKTTNDALDNVLDQYALPRELRGLFLGYLGLSDNAKAELRGMLLRWAQDAAQPEPVQPEHNVHEWTREEMQAEFDRQMDAEEADRKRDTEETSGFGLGKSGTAIA